MQSEALRQDGKQFFDAVRALWQEEKGIFVAAGISGEKKNSCSMLFECFDKKKKLFLNKKVTKYEKIIIKSIGSNIMLFISMGAEWQC